MPKYRVNVKGGPSSAIGKTRTVEAKSASDAKKKVSSAIKSKYAGESDGSKRLSLDTNVVRKARTEVQKKTRERAAQYKAGLLSKEEAKALRKKAKKPTKTSARPAGGAGGGMSLGQGKAIRRKNPTKMWD